MFHRLTKEETEKYLENRRSKGFTVIQAVALAELDGLNTPNAEGHKPLIDNDPLKPDENYWQHVDWVIKKAEENGLFIGLLPTWGDKVDPRYGPGPVVFNKENAYKYGQWIGSRYKNSPNIIWINGGDREGGGDNYPVWNALAEGIKSVDTSHLMTFHPWGGHSSSEWFHNSPWLDFNMCQTGHRDRSYAETRRLLVTDYNLTPVKPCLDGEPRYEDIEIKSQSGLPDRFDDADIRQALYWSLFSGACGHTYGCQAIWQMWSADKKPRGNVRLTWYEALDMPGAFNLIHARRLFESRPFLSRVPDQSMIASVNFSDIDFVVATRGDGYAMVYFPTGLEAEIIPDAIGGKKIKAWWYNPRNGESKFLGTFKGKGTVKFAPPSSGRGNDWILVLDDVAKNFPVPGKTEPMKHF